MFTTNYPDINLLLVTLSTHLKGCFGDDLTGIYLYGSCALGDFNYETSDVDVFVILDTEICQHNFKKIELIHKKLIEVQPKLFHRFEIVYAGLNALQKFKTNNHDIAVTCPRRPFAIKNAGYDWLINYYLVQNYSKIILGPDPKAVIPKISKYEFASCINQIAIEWATLDEIDKINEAIEYQYNTVLTLCRMYYFICNGENVSKLKAATFVSSKIKKWDSLINDALAYHKGSKPRPASKELMKGFIHEIVGNFNPTTISS